MSQCRGRGWNSRSLLSLSLVPHLGALPPRQGRLFLGNAMTDNLTDADIARILTSVKTIAVVGWSPRPDRPSHRVAQFLAARGYRVIPVNPGQVGSAAPWGEPVRATLDEAGPVDMVDIFRRSEAVPDIVDEALKVLPDLKTIWMQLGVENAGAAAIAEAAGIVVIQDRCPKIEFPRLD